MSAAGSDQHFLSKLDKGLDDSEPPTPPLSSSLAEIFNKRFRTKLSEEKFKSRVENYHRPGYCEAMLTPLVNPKICKNIPVAPRRADIKAYHVHKAAVALTDRTQTLLPAQCAAGAETLKHTNTDRLALLGHASYQMSLRRRQAIRPCLHPRPRRALR